MAHIFCGDRNWSEKSIIASALSKIPKDDIIIHGGCRGADVLSGDAAKDAGYNVVVYHADWKRYGKSAGPRRNRQMSCHEGLVCIHAFHDDIETSRGTLNMLLIGKEKGKKCILYTTQNPEGTIFI